jgi:insulysin
VELITPQKIFSVVPVKDLRTIDILWWLPGQDPYPLPSHYFHVIFLLFVLFDRSSFYRVKPTHYLANLIGHEGPGSILSLLKAKGNAFNLLFHILHHYHFCT